MRKHCLRSCRHCGKRTLTQTRGLCYICYGTTDIRAGYLSLFQRCRAELLPLPEASPEPMAHPVHSEAQLAVFAARAARGLPLHHPLDRCVDS